MIAELYLAASGCPVTVLAALLSHFRGILQLLLLVTRLSYDDKSTCLNNVEGGLFRQMNPNSLAALFLFLLLH